MQHSGRPLPNLRMNHLHEEEYKKNHIITVPETIIHNAEKIVDTNSANEQAQVMDPYPSHQHMRDEMDARMEQISKNLDAVFPTLKYIYIYNSASKSIVNKKKEKKKREGQTIQMSY